MIYLLYGLEEYLLKKEEIVALGEMMNFPGVINGDEEVHKKLEFARKIGKKLKLAGWNNHKLWEIN